ncbi:MAG: response regulator [Pseudomonadales bacterium]|nr:response regulator [Pseudomonadales bacterium]MBO6595464.1 response regulator [Pseudomonadales bacterium]MBO6657533.1 response regulator [Pseudomonadales bacterium]MBO6820977.1 response regulator [Pseudomonadales bacterium]
MADKQKIMIVDDEPHILDFYCTVLTNNGYHCVCYSSAEHALKDLDDSFDLLITDNRMPGMTGIEFLEEVIEDREDLRRIMITGSYGTQEQMSSILDNGLAHSMLNKPCGMDHFMTAVKEQLAISEGNA